MENKKRNSIILVLIITLIAIGGIFAVYASKASSTKVLITIDGAQYGQYPLNKDQTIEIKNYGEINIVRIENNTVRVIEANCDNQICVNSYPISKDFPSLIVCLPHGVVIELVD